MFKVCVRSLCPGLEEVTSKTMHSDNVKIKVFRYCPCFKWPWRYETQTKSIAIVCEVLQEGGKATVVLCGVARVGPSFLNDSKISAMRHSLFV